MRDYSGIVFGIFFLIVTQIVSNSFKIDRTQPNKVKRTNMMNLSNKMPVANPDNPDGLAFIEQIGGRYYTLLNEEKAPKNERHYERKKHSSFRAAKRYLQSKGFHKVLDKNKLKENNR